MQVGNLIYGTSICFCGVENVIRRQELCFFMFAQQNNGKNKLKCLHQIFLSSSSSAIMMNPMNSNTLGHKIHLNSRCPAILKEQLYYIIASSSFVFQHCNFSNNKIIAQMKDYRESNEYGKAKSRALQLHHPVMLLSAEVDCLENVFVFGILCERILLYCLKQRPSATLCTPSCSVRLSLAHFLRVII